MHKEWFSCSGQGLADTSGWGSERRIFHKMWRMGNWNYAAFTCNVFIKRKNYELRPDNKSPVTYMYDVIYIVFIFCAVPLPNVVSSFLLQASSPECIDHSLYKSCMILDSVLESKIQQVFNVFLEILDPFPCTVDTRVIKIVLPWWVFDSWYFFLSWLMYFSKYQWWGPCISYMSKLIAC